MTIRRFKNIPFTLFVLTALLLLQSMTLSVQAEMYEKKHVLFISSYTDQYITVPKQIEGMKQAFEGMDIQLDVEYMDTRRIDTDLNREYFFKYLQYKMGQVQPYDAILVGDDAALHFVVDHQNELFSEIPIFFLCINDVNYALEVAENPYISGVVEQYSVPENIEIALKFHPKTKNVVAIVDNTQTGVGDYHQFYAVKPLFPDINFMHLNVSEYSFQEFASVLKTLPEDSVILFLSMNLDKNGEFMYIHDNIRFLTENTNLPIYRPLIGGVGEGFMGGKMISYVESGRLAAQMAVDYFNGTPLSELKVITECPQYYYFDYQKLMEYNVPAGLIPEDAILVNKNPGIFETYYNEIVVVLIILIVLFLVSFVSVISYLRIRIIHKKLIASNTKLEETYTNLMLSEEELREQYNTIQEQVNEITVLNERVENVLENTRSAIWEFNTKTKQVYVSKKMAQLFDLDNSGFMDAATFVQTLVDAESVHTFQKEFRELLEGKRRSLEMKTSLVNAKGVKRWFLIRGKKGNCEFGSTDCIHGIVMEITTLKQKESYIQFLAHHDYLTKLPNRIRFMQMMTEELEQGKSGAVMLLDVDNFKSINDILGHVMGDKLLVAIANRLMEIQNEDLLVSRMGGDEFIILCKNCDTEEKILAKIQSITNTFREPFIIQGKQLNARCSIGITRYPNDGTDVDQLISFADAAMYHVKREGKNNYLFFYEDLKHQLKERTELESKVREALHNSRFYLLYQPQIDVKSGEVIGFEALLRMKDSTIPINKVISVAEEMGLIIEIGRWVTLEVVQLLARWRDKGLAIKPISINFSSLQIRDKTYHNYLKELLDAYNIPPHWLEIEITESMMVEQSENNLHYIEKLAALGINIALDDFGTGYSSLNYLTFMPINKIKLDKTMSDRFLASEKAHIMKSVIHLAHSLHCTILAEGVEEWDQYHKLRECGCDFIQGYLFSKPLTEENAKAIIHKNLLESLPQG